MSDKLKNVDKVSTRDTPNTEINLICRKLWRLLQELL